MKSVTLFSIFCLSLSLTPPSVSAQDLEQDTRQPQNAQAASEQQDAAADEAAKPEAGVEKVTFAQILKDPDNVDLNYRYAKSLVAAGNLRGASAALERILIVNPDLPRIRLFRAIVLYRLDILEEAESEFKALLELEMPDSLRREIRVYLSKIRTKRRSLNFLTRAGLGVQYDSNRNAGPSSGKRLFFSNPVTLTSGGKQSDWSLLTNGLIRAQYDLGMQAGHSVFASAGMFRAEQFDLDTLDLTAYQFQTGAIVRTPEVDVIPAVSYDIVRLAGDTLVKNFTGSLRLSRKLDDRTNLGFGYSLGYQDYEATPNVTFARDRAGHRGRWTLNAGRVLTSRTRADCSVNYTDNATEKRFNSFEAMGATCHHSRTLGRGMFLITSAGLEELLYDQADNTVSSIRREDTVIRLRGSFGVPLARFHKFLNGASGVLSYEYLDSRSNLLNYDYTNHKGSLNMTYRFEY